MRVKRLRFDLHVLAVCNKVHCVFLLLGQIQYLHFGKIYFLTTTSELSHAFWISKCVPSHNMQCVHLDSLVFTPWVESVGLSTGSDQQFCASRPNELVQMSMFILSVHSMLWGTFHRMFLLSWLRNVPSTCAYTTGFMLLVTRCLAHSTSIPNSQVHACTETGLQLPTTWFCLAGFFAWLVLSSRARPPEWAGGKRVRQQLSLGSLLEMGESVLTNSHMVTLIMKVANAENFWGEITDLGRSRRNQECPWVTVRDKERDPMLSVRDKERDPMLSWILKHECFSTSAFCSRKHWVKFFIPHTAHDYNDEQKVFEVLGPELSSISCVVCPHS